MIHGSNRALDNDCAPPTRKAYPVYTLVPPAAVVGKPKRRAAAPIVATIASFATGWSDAEGNSGVSPTTPVSLRALDTFPPTEST